MTEITDIEDLPGVGEATAQKLRDAGFKTLQSIAVAAPGELIDAAGVGEATAKKAINAARDSLEMGFETAAEIMKRRESVAKLTTGSEHLDELIGGGLESQAITEVYGKFGSSKSQIAFQLAVNVQLPKEKGGLDGACLFVDTEHTFRPERVVQMAKAAGLDSSEVLNNIYVANAANVDHQMLLVDKAADMIEEKNIKLIIVDSLTSRFRAEFVGRGTLADRQQRLNRHLHKLQKWADMYNLVIFVTNQVMANPALMFGDPTTPIGGHIVGHHCTTRIYLRKSKDQKRIAKLVDSPHMADGECVFKVTGDGITD